ncbi:hypothetical protein ACF073_39105 [Streptomyces sp. NPDC015171]|uniref:hypothetical protein n=1 Tax=Streptomyces sp. NPDC015171 TaxID=3364945 RepID=UPI0036FED576
MAEPRHPSRLAGFVPRKLMPPPALCGFMVLLVLVFSVSYAVGSASGPVAPGMHGTGTGGGPGGDGGGGTGDMPGMHGGGE